MADPVGAPVEPGPVTPPARGRLRRRVILVLLLLVGACGVQVGRALLTLGIQPVIPGALYRSGQPDGPGLDAWVDEFGLRSVISTRGDEAAESWFDDELAVVQRRGLEFFTVKLDGDEMPSRERLARLVRHIDDAPRPALIHCNWGVERSGLAAAIALLLEGESIATANAQLTYRHGIERWLTGSDLPDVIVDYEGWLAATDRAHTPDLLRHWAAEVYIPYFYANEVVLEREPEVYRCGEEIEVTVRLVNASRRPWRHRAERDRGVHFEVRLKALDDGPAWSASVRGGYVDLTVAPGEASVFDVSLGAFPRPGPYLLEVAMVNEMVAWFAAEGGRDFRTTLEVLPAAGDPAER